jgi:PAS domain S-box-containing protein
MSAEFIALLLGPAILVPLACFALARRQVRGASWYAILLLTIALWSLAYAWELSSDDLAAKMLALKTKYVGVVLVPPCWIGFVLSFVGHRPAHVRRRVLPIALVSALMLGFAWTDQWHGVFWGPMSLHEVDGYSVLRGRGPLFWVNVFYSYAVLSTGLVVLALHAVHSPYLYRARARILTIGAVVPWVGNVVFIVRLSETTVDPTPFLFSCTAVIAALAVFRYKLLEPVPTLKDARIEAVGDGVVILDRSYRIADLNPAAEAFLGCSRAQGGGRSIDSVVPGWPAGSLPATPIDVSIGIPSGPRTYDVRCTPIRSRAGELTGVVVVLRDVTERRLAERALRDSELRYRTVIEQASDGVWVADGHSTIVDVNPGACVMLGYTRTELIGRPVVDVVEPEDLEELPVHRNDLRHGQAVDWHGRVVAKSGRRLLLAGRSTQVSHDLIVTTFRDITEQRAQSRQRERLLTEARAAIRLKDEFLATLSHELRTPISAVLGWTRMLARHEVEPARVAHALGVIERNALAQARLVDDLLDVSRMAAGRLRLSLAETDLTEVVHEALDAIGPSAQGKGVALEMTLDPSLPRVEVDRERIQQVLWNLLTNAIKFTQRGGTVIMGSAATTDGVELTVRDTGRGIAPEFLPFVFDPFRQGEGSGSRGVAGLGLGLAIVRRIIEAHGGRVEAASAGVGTGATFRVHLPTIAHTTDVHPLDHAGTLRDDATMRADTDG